MPGKIRTWTVKWAVISVLGCGMAAAGMSPAIAQSVPHKKMTASVLWNQILAHHITYIQEGHAGPVIYDFQDPNCPYCHVMYEHEAPFIQEGRLTVRYVPVAFLTPQSPAEAAAWLESPHPLQALEHFETVVGPALRSGNYSHLPKTKLTARIRKELHSNLEMMSALGFEGTPAILYRTKAGQIGRIPGMISQRQLGQLLPHLR